MKTQLTFIQVSLTAIALATSGCMIEGSAIVDDDREPFTPDEVEEQLPDLPTVDTQRVVILHTNDEHSHLLGFAPNNIYPFRPHTPAGDLDPATVATEIAMGRDQETAGGIVRRQFLINQIRETIADPVLLLSAGDSAMGTIFHAAFTQAAPDYVAMSILGYDFMTLGNHEFDFGPDSLAAAIRAANDTTFGAATRFVSSNVHFAHDADGNPLTDLENLYGEGNSGAPIVPWATKLLPNGLKVGFIGLTGYDAALVSPALGPISFSVPTDGDACTSSDDCAGVSRCVRRACVDPLDLNGHLAALFADAAAAVSELEAEEVDLVVAITHLGDLEDQALAANVDGIDVIIGGHSHDERPAYEVNGTIITQSGSYGRKLGKLVVVRTRTNDGTWGDFGFDDPASEILDVDWTLDAGIVEGSDFMAMPPVLSPALLRALELSGAVITPVAAGLNAMLEPLLDTDATPGNFNLFDPKFRSTYDVIGEKVAQDHQLFHLVTDAELLSVIQGACLNPVPAAGGKITVGVQADGVIRESLRFAPEMGDAVGDPEWTTIADLFRVLPLGASPFEANSLPGYPLVMFDLALGDLFAGLDIGVTKGLQSYSFFLSYSGLRVEYNTDFPPLDPVALATGADEPGGRVTKIEVLNQLTGDWDVIYDYTLGTSWATRWVGVNPTPPEMGLGGTTVTVITNLYLAGFLDGFGITVRDPVDGLPFDPIATLGAGGVLAQTILCQVGGPADLDCGAGVPIMAPCAQAGVAASGLDCAGIGYAGGTISCLEAACVLDTSGCIPFECGDGNIDGLEQCDGADLGAATGCSDVGFGGGTLACDAVTCQYDTSGCTDPVCGNGTLDGAAGEQCDGTDFGGATCGAIIPEFTGGTLACDASCAYDLTGCTGTTCGDGVREGIEECDGTDGVMTCDALPGGFSGGEVVCTDACTIDASGCSRPLCGNMTLDGGEMCDPGVEAKEWGVLINFIAYGFGGVLPVIPSTPTDIPIYGEGPGFETRVKDVTP